MELYPKLTFFHGFYNLDYIFLFETYAFVFFKDGLHYTYLLSNQHLGFNVGYVLPSFFFCCEPRVSLTATEVSRIVLLLFYCFTV